MRADRLEMFTVYWNPLDHPCRYVVRRSQIGPEGTATDVQPLAVELTLGSARAALPLGLYRQTRYPLDDPSILEVWF